MKGRVKVRIVTDSTTDLSRETIEKYQIEVVPLSIHIDEKTYIDQIEITPSEFMKKMAESKELPKSSQPPAGAFVEVYDRLGEDGTEILSIHMTSGMSGTVNSAESAALMTKSNVTVVDSRFISGALGFQVVEAAKMAAEGKTVAEIVAGLDAVRENTRIFVVVDTLENLIKGGRIGKGSGMIGSLLNIKPIASLEGGSYNPVAKVRSHSQVVKYVSKHFAEDVKDKVIKGVLIAHAEGQGLAKKVEKAIEEATGYRDVEIVETTPIISTHTGPGAIGFSYYFE